MFSGSKRVPPDDARRDGKDGVGGGHEHPHKAVGDGHAHRRPHQREGRRGGKGVALQFPDAVAFARAEVGGQHGLRRLTDAVSAALHKGADVDDNAIHRQRVSAEAL